MTCGIYMLSFDGTHKVYVGKSKAIEGRFSQHINVIQKFKHSVKMNNAYIDFGIPTLHILEIAPEERLDDLEVFYIEKYNSFHNGFNSTSASIGLSTRNEYWEARCKYDKDQILSTFNFLIEDKVLNHKVIGEICGLPKATVAGIAMCKTHRWLEVEYPEEYKLLISKINTGKSYAKSAESQGIYYPIIISPNGEEFAVENTCEFARVHGLNQPHLHKVLTKQRQSHKGWQLLSTLQTKEENMSWTEAQKEQAIKAYEDGKPTPENSTELIKEIAENMEQSANGVRMVLVQAGVYVKKEAATGGASKGGEKAEGTKRVSKESQIAELTAAIEAKGAEVDAEILSKLTGKAAAYFTKVLAA